MILDIFDEKKEFLKIFFLTRFVVLIREFFGGFIVSFCFSIMLGI